jgi:cytochrome c
MKHAKIIISILFLVAAAGVSVFMIQNVLAQRLILRTRAVSTETQGNTAGGSVKEFPGASDQWKDSQDTAWIAAERSAHQIKPHFDNRALLQGGQQAGHTYGNYTEADTILWQQETERLVVEGSRIFHSAQLLGSTNGVSCDMCHPDGEGTHPQTYPKYQVQLGRAALLPDMMNWCLENPCRGEPMSAGDPRLRAMEAYIWAQGAGKVLEYGKH